MTKKWSSIRSGSDTKRAASKAERKRAAQTFIAMIGEVIDGVDERELADRLERLEAEDASSHR